MKTLHQELKGQIVKINSDLYYVNCNNIVYICKCLGKMRNKNITPLVGDYVTINPNDKQVTDILPRHNSLERPSVANIDQCIIVTSLKEPDFSANLLDKLLVICEINKIKPIICLTKEDLLSSREKRKYKVIIRYYKSIGYKVISNKLLLAVKKTLKNKITVLTGQTGAGKSTLLNKLNTNLNLETASISKALGRGKHTTRMVELFELCEGKVLDTPGFSALDFKKYTKEEIRDSFVEFAAYKCPYKDCFHIKEKECLIKKKVLSKKILTSRYENYQKLIEGGG